MTCFSLARKETIGDVRRDRRLEQAAGRRGYRAGAPRHDSVARERDVSVARCAGESESRQTIETLAAERNESTETEMCLTLDI